MSAASSACPATRQGCSPAGAASGSNGALPPGAWELAAASPSTSSPSSSKSAGHCGRSPRSMSFSATTPMESSML
eukprot:8756323-Pyramimonas_sp.AAC.1